MPRPLKIFLLAAIAILALPAQPRKLKIHISVDMEGIAGVVSNDQLSPGSFEYERFRNFMTAETVAAIDACGDADIVVADSHGNGENILIEKLPANVRLVRAFPRRLGMMAGIDSSFNAAIFIGYHASTNNLKGVRAHTFSSARLTRVSLNGSTVTEGSFNAAVAGHFGVPVIMMSGDEAAVAEVRSQIGNIEAVETKTPLSFHSAESITPEASCRLIGQKVRAALARLQDYKPYRVTTPVTLEMGFKNYRPVELLSWLRGVERPDSHTIRYRGQNMLEIIDFVEFVTSYDFNLEP